MKCLVCGKKFENGRDLCQNCEEFFKGRNGKETLEWFRRKHVLKRRKGVKNEESETAD